jgi:hypothetical protein
MVSPGFYYPWVKKLAGGLILEPSTTAVHDIQLTEPASLSTISKAEVCRLRLHNTLARMVRPRLVADLWEDALNPVEPDGVQTLPLLALRPGTYVVDDASVAGNERRLAIVTVGDH